MADIIEHNLPEPDGIIQCAEVADIGCGIRPFNWYQPVFHICVEPYGPYCDVLEATDYYGPVFRQTAKEFLETCDPVEAIYLLDVIEHMYKDDGWRVIELALEKATTQVVVFTPKGFMEQTTDNWGLGGHDWQTHRSGWLPGEFPDWKCSWYGRGFFAIWTSPRH